ncbi:hypothetical protein O181_006581 [Austropuccinia psidii MF-1]|uniref:Uncharacterized protein n=1 Tax=Austropuccinia psidii MF-1 TaxID=1389203 RepID=A0A9Q3BL59_9BASI|nr:hypothetical protein [Austropuccinia psidii MF-1]
MGMRYIHGTPTKLLVFIDCRKHLLIIVTSETFPDVTRHYLDETLPLWGTELLPTKAKIFKSASEEVKSLDKITIKVIVAHKKGNKKGKMSFKRGNLTSCPGGLSPKSLFCKSVGKEAASGIPTPQILLYILMIWSEGYGIPIQILSDPNCLLFISFSPPESENKAPISDRKES